MSPDQYMFSKGAVALAVAANATTTALAFFFFFKGMTRLSKEHQTKKPPKIQWAQVGLSVKTWQNSNDTKDLTVLKLVLL